jgi:hypothetical protein
MLAANSTAATATVAVNARFTEPPGSWCKLRPTTSAYR